MDWGGTRIGIAVGESEFGVITPRPALRASGALQRDAQAISQLAKKEEAEQIVVGVPFHETEPKMARVCLQLAQHLRQIGWKVEEQDEAMTSLESETELRTQGLKASERRKHIDGEAASRILTRYFEHHA